MAPCMMTSSGVEVSGEFVRLIVKGMVGLRKRARHILALGGLHAPSTTDWYAQEDLLGVFAAIGPDGGQFGIYNIGARVGQDAAFPVEVESVETALAQLDALYRQSHRGAKQGSYRFEPTGTNSGRIVCDTPYPCDFDRGLIEAVARRFRPEGSWNVTVEEDPSAGGKAQGGGRCAYLVRW